MFYYNDLRLNRFILLLFFLTDLFLDVFKHLLFLLIDLFLTNLFFCKDIRSRK
jgi:hypothetical protein